MNKNKYHKALIILTAGVWFLNGLFCKVLNLVPKHEEIVYRVLGGTYSSSITTIIGVLEIVMAFWILSGFKSKLNAILQITIVAVMNIIEYIHVSDLLLWGKLNILFAFLFISIVYYTNFKHNKDYDSIS